MFLFQSVFVVGVDLEDRELVFAQSIDLIVLAQLDLLHISRNLVIANLLGIEVK